MDDDYDHPDSVKHSVDHVHHHHHGYHVNPTMKTGETQMDNIYTAGAAGTGLGGGGGWGAGLGGGLIGGVLGGALLNNRGGLFGNGVGNADGVVTPTMLSSALNGVQSENNTNAILTGLARIEASIPANEAQVQLALAGVQNTLQTNANTAATSLMNQIANSTASIIAAEGSVKESVLVSSALTNNNIKDASILAERNAWAITQAISCDGDKTRALIQSTNDANLQRQLTVAENALLEQRSFNRSRDVEVNVTQSVNQNQVQLQAQAQQQQQLQVLIQQNALLANLAGDIQNIRSTQQSINFGTQVGSGNQASTNNQVR